MLAIIGLSYAFSSNKKAINWKLVLTVLDVQFLGMLLAFIPGGFYEVTLLSLIFGFDVAFVAFHHSIRVVLVFLLLPLTVSKIIKKV